MSDEKKGFFRGLREKLAGGSSREEQERTPEEVPKPEEEDNKESSFFFRLRKGLSKTQDNLVGRIDRLVLGKKEISPDILEELEEILITADLGMTATGDLITILEERLRRNELRDGEAVRNTLRQELKERLVKVAKPIVPSGQTFVIMVVGVNGVGKTTTIGKIASKYTSQGKKVVLAAADTFRAAAAEQLEIWGKRAGVDVVRHGEGADPAAVVFDACKAAVARGADVLIIDTAGRLHTKVHLMEELKKLYRVMGREIPGAPHETLLVVDAATGQNAVSQTKLFREAAAVTGIVLTKLDGTAKGGIIVAIASEFGIPVRFVGVGEGIEDLRELDPDAFVDALFT